MLVIDSGLLLALAALVTATGTLIWSIRRNP
jgi:hypothetical protein